MEKFSESSSSITTLGKQSVSNYALFAADNSRGSGLRLFCRKGLLVTSFEDQGTLTLSFLEHNAR